MRAKYAKLIQQSNGLFKIHLDMALMHESRNGEDCYYYDLEKEEAERIVKEVNERASEWNKEYYSLNEE